MGEEYSDTPTPAPTRSPDTLMCWQPEVPHQNSLYIPLAKMGLATPWCQGNGKACLAKDYGMVMAGLNQT